MKSYIKIFVPFLLVILFGSLTVIFAQSDRIQSKNENRMHPPPPHGIGPQAGLAPHILEQLDLTDEQINKIGRLRDSAFYAERPFVKELRTAENKLRELSGPDDFNEEQARLVLASKAQVTSELELIRLRTDSEIYGVLTPEQILQVEMLKQKRPERKLPPTDGFRSAPSLPN